METLVMKFGGSSVSTPQSFLKLAKIISTRRECFSNIVVVISAMGDTTDQLLDLAKKVHPNPPRREQDMLVSVGERISGSLLAMALEREGVEAVSMTGSQAGIITTARHSNARILDVKPYRLFNHLRERKIVIVAGFQGVGLSGDVTTLGRGGSDTSAVALAAALSSKRVEFYKDVSGIFSEDPKKNSNASLLNRLTYDEAKSLAKDGVLHPRCIQLAKQNQIALHILSYNEFESNEKMNGMGTYIFSEDSDQELSFEREEDYGEICI